MRSNKTPAETPAIGDVKALGGFVYIELRDRETGATSEEIELALEDGAILSDRLVVALDAIEYRPYRLGL